MSTCNEPTDSAKQLPLKEMANLRDTNLTEKFDSIRIYHKPLRVESNSSLYDSGIESPPFSRNTSGASILSASGEPYAASLDAIHEGNADPGTNPIINVSDEPNVIPQNGSSNSTSGAPANTNPDLLTSTPAKVSTSSLDSINFLTVPRKYSTSSLSSHTSSDEYVTPPTSPQQAPAYDRQRSMSMESNSSTASSSQDVQVRVKVEVDGAKNLQLQAKTRVSKRKEYVEVLMKLKIGSNSPMRMRSLSSPSSTPSSPLHSQKSSRKISEQSTSSSHSSQELLPQVSEPEITILQPVVRDQTAFSIRSASPIPIVPLLSEVESYKRNKFIEDIVRRFMAEFVRLTDLDTLSPYLFARKLVSNEDLDYMKDIKGSRGRKNYFYMLLLNRKGSMAHSDLYSCLKEESEHPGHRDLANIIERELKMWECGEKADEHMPHQWLPLTTPSKPQHVIRKQC